MEERRGPDDLETLFIVQRDALRYWDWGSLDDAVLLFEHAQEGQSKRFGEDSIYVIKNTLGLAATTMALSLKYAGEGKDDWRAEKHRQSTKSSERMMRENLRKTFESGLIHQSVAPIQDVRTRWNSTYLILRRAKCLQSVLNEFCSQYENHELQPSQEEWRQIDYLLSITQPFFTFTTSLSKTKEVTIHSVFAIYNNLFAHLDRSRAQLARQKAISTILAPQNKLEFFSTEDCEPNWRVRYRKSLEDYLIPYQQRYSESQPTLNGQPSTTAYDELSRYLGSSTQVVNPRTYWKNHQHEFPILPSLARDVLTTPASDSGAERLFNSARDICHYR
ncbi:hypothetical protein FE257_004960 [Aspergillus nanangensis]|uniref:HAT C-terminal dimerisation domain-containing protein n=1 Tax=Aspergillus nanangensis TaxID=2582783 RepID=A0AAD4CAT1_ASPNN|nr:hypothetical protein FE257_004960 [Aspergillus nanangensis]